MYTVHGFALFVHLAAGMNPGQNPSPQVQHEDAFFPELPGKFAAPVTDCTVGDDEVISVCLRFFQKLLFRKMLTRFIQYLIEKSESRGIQLLNTYQFM